MPPFPGLTQSSCGAPPRGCPRPYLLLMIFMIFIFSFSLLSLSLLLFMILLHYLILMFYKVLKVRL